MFGLREKSSIDAGRFGEVQKHIWIYDMIIGEFCIPLYPGQTSVGTRVVVVF